MIRARMLQDVNGKRDEATLAPEELRAVDSLVAQCAMSREAATAKVLERREDDETVIRADELVEIVSGGYWVGETDRPADWRVRSPSGLFARVRKDQIELLS
jgi:hypothetical protein